MSEFDVLLIVWTFAVGCLFICSLRDFSRLRRMAATGWRARKVGLFWTYVRPCGTKYDSFRKAWNQFKDDLDSVEIKMYDQKAND